MKRALALKKTLITLGAVGVITVVGFMVKDIEVEPMQPKPVVEEIVEVEKCKEVELDVAGTRMCLTSKDYTTIKKNLHTEYKDQSKEHDFDINKRDIFLAILSKEIKENGIEFNKLKDKDYIMETLFNN